MYQVVIKINRPNLPPRYQEVRSKLTLTQANRLSRKIIKRNLRVFIIKNILK